MNNLDEFNKIKKEVNAYQRDNTSQITKHFNKKSWDLLPKFRLAANFAMILLIAVLISQQLQGNRMSSGDGESVNNDSAEAPSFNDKDEDVLTIYQVILQVESSTEKGYEVTLQSLELTEIELYSPERLEMGQYYYVEDDEIYEAKFQGSDWYYYKDSTWKMVNP